MLNFVSTIKTSSVSVKPRFDAKSKLQKYDVNMNAMFLIILFICLSVSVKCNDNDEGKYIDLLPEMEKREFLQRVARRILEEVDSKHIAKGPASDTLNDVKLDETSSYVSKLLNEEAADLKRRSMNLQRNKTKRNASLRGGDKQKEKYVDLTLRQGPKSLDLKEGNIPGQKESTTNTIITGLDIGIESTTYTTEEAVPMMREKLIEDVIKTNDLPLIGIENVTEISNVATSTQVVTTSSPIEDKTKRNFRRSEEKIDIKITIEDANATKSPKIKVDGEPPNPVHKDNFNKSGEANKTNESKNSDTIPLTPNNTTKHENSIQDDTKFPKMRVKEGIVRLINKDNLNKSIRVGTNTSNESTYSDIAISTLKSVNLNESSLRNSTKQAPDFPHDVENQAILTQEKHLRNDKDIIELERDDDDFLENTRRKEVNVIPEEEENYKEVNTLPEDDVDTANQKNTHPTVINDIPEVSVTGNDTSAVTAISAITSEVMARAKTDEGILSTEIPIIISTHTPEAMISSSDGSKVDIPFTNDLNGTITSTEHVNTTSTMDNSTLPPNNFPDNATRGLHFRASDILWPQAENYSSVAVFDSDGNETDVKTMTEDNSIQSTTDAKLISVMSTKPQKKQTEDSDKKRTFRKSMNSANNFALAPATSSIQGTDTKAFTLDTESNAGPIPSTTEDYPNFRQRLYSHEPSNEVKKNVVENPLWSVTRKPDSEVTSEYAKPIIKKNSNIFFNKNGGHSITNKDIYLQNVSKKPDLEINRNDLKITTEVFPYFLKDNNTSSTKPASKFKLLHNLPQTTTNTIKHQQSPKHPFESVTQIERELDTLTTENADDLTLNMENTKVELIEKKAHKAKVESVPTSQTKAIHESSQNEAQVTYGKVLISKNEYPIVRAQQNESETKIPESTSTKLSTIRQQQNEPKNPLYVSTSDVNLKVVPIIAHDNKATTTEVQSTPVMNTKTKFFSTSPSIGSIHIERRTEEYESIGSEIPTIYSTTKEALTIGKTATDFITTKYVSEATSAQKIGLLSEPTSESANDAADKLVSERAIELGSILAYEPTSTTTDQFASNLPSKSTVKPVIQLSTKVNNDTNSEMDSVTLSSTSRSVNDSGAGLAIQIHSTLASDRNNEAASKFPSDLVSAQVSNFANNPKSELNSKLINEPVNEPAPDLATETSNQGSNDASSVVLNEFASESSNERTSKLPSESGIIPINKSIQDRGSASKLGNVTLTKSGSQSANESLSESITIGSTSQPLFEVQSEVEQSTKSKNKLDELKDITTTLSPIALTSDQIEKPVDEPNRNLEFTHVTTDNMQVNTTVAENTIVMPLSTTEFVDIEVKTEKFNVESTTRNYDSSEIMTKVPKVAQVYVPNIPTKKAKPVQNSKPSLQLGLVPQDSVTEKKFEGLIQFHTSHVTKEYSVYEIRKYKIYYYMNVMMSLIL